MKKLRWIIFIWTCLNAATYGEMADLEALREYYRRSLVTDTDQKTVTTENFASAWAKGVDSNELDLLRDAIAVHDETIDIYIVRHLFWRISRYLPNLPMSPPVEPLTSLTDDEAVRHFIERMLNATGKVPPSVFLVAAMLYGGDAEFLERIAAIGLQKEDQALHVIRAATLARIKHPDIAELVRNGLESDCAALVSEAAHYLARFPDETVAARLVELMLMTDTDLVSQLKSRSLVSFRINVTAALMALNASALAPYRNDILSAGSNEYITFPDQSLAAYERLLRKLREIYQ